MRRTAKRLLRRIGVDVRRFRPRLAGPEGPDFPFRRARILDLHRIDLVLDVGANVGQYGRELRLNGYESRIVSFEPVSAAFAELDRRTHGDPSWECHQLALSDTDGVATINVGTNTAWSSLLVVDEADFGLSFASVERVSTRRLDAVADEHVHLGERVWLKVDVQGVELDVLRGAEGVLHRIDGIEIELVTWPLYAGQAAYRDVLDYLERRGFRLVAVDSGFMHATGYAPYFDAILVRPHAGMA